MKQGIIRDFTDDDFYKFSMQQVVLNQFPEAKVRYEYFNRAEDKRVLHTAFVERLQEEVNALQDLSLSLDMLKYFVNRTPWLKRNYLEWLTTYRYNPNEVSIYLDEAQHLHIEIEGPWYRTILWEVKLLAIITELDNALSNNVPEAGWKQKIWDKGHSLSFNNVSWIDFGTRRRFSFDVQEEVNNTMKTFQPWFRGTSNPYIAHLHDLPINGTFAHELPMALQVKYGVENCNLSAMDAWQKEYRGDLGIALTDTITTDKFLGDFDGFYARLFDGMRQDSGDPFEEGEKFIAHYESLRIAPTSKVAVFSDGLTTEKSIALHRHFLGRINTTMGIGTHLTNDVGHKPHNHVIKLTHADFGRGMKPTLKLSNDAGKVLGEKKYVEACKTILGLD